MNCKMFALVANRCLAKNFWWCESELQYVLSGGEQVNCKMFSSGQKMNCKMFALMASK